MSHTIARLVRLLTVMAIFRHFDIVSVHAFLIRQARARYRASLK
jgi:hypothetical protein